MFTKHWILAFTLTLAAGGFAEAQPLAKPNLDYYFSHGIATLIEQLGNSSYAKRESAHKTIESFGPMALDQLRRFRTYGSTEGKRRVEELIRRAEEKQIAQQILTPKEMMLDLKNATVHDAITDLAAKSGYPIQFQGDATQFFGKRVTLEGKLSFWQALDKLCEQGGLMERIDVADIVNPYTRVGSPYGSTRPQGPLTLINRHRENSTVSYAGAVKTELRLNRDKNSNEVNVLFVISAEPRLLQHTLVGDAVLDKCVDAVGKHLQTIQGAEKSKANDADEKFRLAELERIAAFNAADPSAAFRRTAQFRVKDGNVLQQIRELAGKLTMQVDLQNETLARIDKVLDASGKSADGANGGQMTVKSIKKLPDGNIEANISLENMFPNPFGANIVVNGKGGVVIRGNVIINGGNMVIGPNGVRISSSGTGSTKDIPDLLDAKGQKFKKAVFDDNFVMSNNSSSRTARIVFQPNAGQAEPTELVLYGTRTYTIAVPFHFENVRLP